MEYKDAAKIPAVGGAVYDGRFRYSDVSLGSKLNEATDEDVKSVGFGFFPDPVALVRGLTIEVTFGPVGSRLIQVGVIDSVERVNGRTMTVIHFTDVAETGTLGTIDDLTVIDNGSGSVVLTWTPIDGVTAYQAQVDAVDNGASVAPELTIIVLSGLVAGSKTFTIDATDGTTTTSSNAVEHTVV